MVNQTDRDRIEALIAKWRASCAATREEISAGGIRAQHPEGPRYGIAAVLSCADELADLLAAQATTGWQRIETAPKDSTSVLLWEPSSPCRHDGIVMTGQFVDFSGHDVPADYHSGWFDDTNGHYEIHPTHWMPLPAPPVALSGEQE